MASKTLGFREESFAISVLHHVDLTAAGRKIGRVVKPTAKAEFIEALGHNPLLKFLRCLRGFQVAAQSVPCRLKTLGV